MGKTCPTLYLRKAYTLTELALVLCLAGMIGGGLWAVFGDVRTSSGIVKIKDQTLAVVQNVRTFYGPRGVISPCPTDFTGTLDDNSRQLIPIDMRSDRNSDISPINHALGGVVTGNSNSGSFVVECANAGTAINVRLRNLPRRACMDLLMTFPVLVPEIGVISIKSSGSPLVAIDARNIAAAAAIFPFSPANAQARCAAATSTNEVAFGFRLHN